MFVGYGTNILRIVQYTAQYSRILEYTAQLFVGCGKNFSPGKGKGKNMSSRVFAGCALGRCWRGLGLGFGVWDLGFGV